MISQEQADEFADDWIAAWNAHDLDRIMAYYAEEIPFVVRLLNDPVGSINGKLRLRAYFEPGLSIIRISISGFFMLCRMSGA